MSFLESLLYSASNAKLFVKKHAPTLLTITAVGSTLGAVVTTASATWKAKDVIEAHNAEVEDINKEIEETNSEEAKKKLGKKYLSTGLELADLYLAPVILTGISVASSISSNKISNSRIAALGASYTMIKQMYDKYRENVRKKYGEEADQDILLGAKEVEREVVDEKGKVKKVKEKEYDVTSAVSNPCAVLLGDGIDSVLQGNRWYDINMLRSIENKLTYEINSNGYILMMDIAKELGIKPGSKYEHDLWSTHGIVKSQARIENVIAKAKAEGREATEEEIINANRLDLGLNNPKNVRYISGAEPMIWILPNLDGDIMPYIFPTAQEQRYLEAITD